MSQRLILASTSPHRRKLLEDAGLSIEVVAPDIDERSVEAPLSDTGATPADVATVLATAKALAVSELHPGRLVLGFDQVLSLDGEILHKPQDMEAARRRLLQLSGRTHRLDSAAVLARDGDIVWSGLGTATLTMRRLDPGFIGRHLARVGSRALSSVGAYQIEGEGIQLFSKIEGDLFTIVGVPLLAVLEALREHSALDG
jgi:septum formation protein